MTSNVMNVSLSCKAMLHFLSATHYQTFTENP